MNPKKSNSGFLVVLLILVIGAYYFISVFQPGSGDYTYQQFMKDVKSDKVTAVTIKQNKEVPTGTITAEFGKDDYKSCEVTDVNQAINDIKKADSSLANKISIKGIDHSGDMISNLIGVVLPIGVVIFFMVMMMRQNGGGGGKMMDFGKSRAKLANPNGKKVTFNDVAGLTEEKEELEEVVEFLKNPGRFIKIGARIPKGVLLVGPPGTGKTLLAKAVAGEANVPFFSISGSDFVEMFVGTGASRVRDMFKKAKQTAPCIVFIDEIDAVGRMRGAGMGGGNDEREQTLNQLLVEMDGMSENTGIVIIAATNRPDVLDPALLRSGRFDRQITVNLPDKKGRQAILEVHARNKKLASDVNLDNLAKRTPGFSGADLENVLNEGAILAVRDSRNLITMDDLDEAIDRVMMGPAKKSKTYTDKEKRLVAYHETGHTIIGLKLENADMVQKVTIIPRGDAGGYNLMTPREEKMMPTKADFMAQITGLLGGRVAEEVVFNEISAGASNDIQKATKIAKAMVRSFGMSSLGPIQYDDGSGNVFLGRDYGSGNNYSGEIAFEIDKEVRRIINECYENAKAIIKANRTLMDLIAVTLMEEETLTNEQIMNLVEYGTITNPNEPVKPAVTEPVEATETLEEGVEAAAAAAIVAGSDVTVATDADVVVEAKPVEKPKAPRKPRAPRKPKSEGEAEEKVPVRKRSPKKPKAEDSKPSDDENKDA